MIIFTPTYNRKGLLSRLYQSLVNQDSHDFTWYIVDDGSMDGTDKLVEDWKQDNLINIVYTRQQNSGKHVAYNFALKYLNRDWSLCVDSDDYLLPDAISYMLKDINVIAHDKSIIGIAYPQMSSHERNFERWNQKQMAIVAGIPGLKETTRLFRPGSFTDFQFPVFSNESYVGEDVLYFYTALKGKTLFIDRVVIKTEYQEGGLSSDYVQLWKQNPRGTQYALSVRVSYYLKMLSGSNVSSIFKAIMNLEAFNMSQNWPVTEGISNKLLGYLLIVPSIFWRFIRFA